MSDEPDATTPPPDAAPAKKAAKDKKKGKSDKAAKGGKKSKKDKKGDRSTSVSGHPRAAAAVRRAKGFGGLAGFALAGLLAHGAGLSISHSLERALLGGIGGYLIAWACAVTVWRQLLIAQMRALAAQRPATRPARRTLPIGGASDGAAGEPEATAALPAAPPAPGR